MLLGVGAFCLHLIAEIVIFELLICDDLLLIFEIRLSKSPKPPSLSLQQTALTLAVTSALLFLLMLASLAARVSHPALANNTPAVCLALQTQLQQLVHNPGSSQHSSGCPWLQCRHLLSAAGQRSSSQTPQCRQQGSCGWPALLQQHRHLSAGRSSSSSEPPLTLKQALRQLYLRVHPDLFHDYPAEQVRAHSVLLGEKGHRVKQAE